MLKCVEGSNADWVAELPRHEIGDDSFEVHPLDFGFAVNAALPAEAINYEVDGLIRDVRHDGWRPTGLTHGRTPRNRTGNSIKCVTTCSGAHWVRLKPLGVVCDRP